MHLCICHFILYIQFVSLSCCFSISPLASIFLVWTPPSSSSSSRVWHKESQTVSYPAKVAKFWIVQGPGSRLPHGLWLEHLKQALKGNPSALQGYKIAPRKMKENNMPDREGSYCNLERVNRIPIGALCKVSLSGFPSQGLGFPSFSRISEKLCVVLHRIFTISHRSRIINIIQDLYMTYIFIDLCIV